ncbi:MAG: TSUP family transporter [Opitutaceae bacterium]|nr:TSUP family transporter [Opitutaceae bacterium]MBP9913575.1 TSUP family transporter [Opitutaceae bacterium]
MEWAPWIYPLLFLTGLIAGLVDAIAGGGGLITVPVLLNLGLPVPLALGTNKLQASCGSVMASWTYVRRGVVDFRACHSGILLTLAGAGLGAVTVQLLDTRLLTQLVPWLLGAILLYTIFRPEVGRHDHPPRLRWSWFYTAFGLGLGFYDGFFGPGVGSFWTIAFIAAQGFNFTKATGYTKVMNATSNLAALAVFALHGSVQLGAGLAMGAGQLVGARLGAGLVVKKGARFVRPIFLTMVGLTLLRLLYVTVTRPS